MLVSLKGVSLSLGGRVILKEITLDLPTAGRCLLLGVNGAGKTTLLRLASGALKWESGRVLLDGRPGSRAGLRRAVARMPQSIKVVPGLSVEEQVAFAGWVGGLDEKDARRKAPGILEQVGLSAERRRRPAHLSGGQRRRLGLAEALCRPADVLLLDEPSAGLDPAQRILFRGLLESLGKPMMVSTHQLDDASALYERVVVLHGGTIRFDGSFSDYIALGEDATLAPEESAFLRLTGMP